jgi:hypothetical protein
MNNHFITNKEFSINLPLTEITFKFNGTGSIVRFGNKPNDVIIRPGVYQILTLGIEVHLTHEATGFDTWAFTDSNRIELKTS